MPTDSARIRRAFFWTALVATPLVLLAAAEILARAILPTDADSPLALRGDPVFFERFERGDEPWVRIAHDELYGSGRVELPVHKPSGALRVFALGGSASAGWPHPPEESYASFLAHALSRVLPNRRVEVFDASAHAWASYRVRLVLRQVLELEPDLVVVYSGNNEFLERRTYLDAARLASPVRNLALVRGLRRLLLPWLAPGTALAADHREHTTAEVWTKLRQQALELRSDPLQFERLAGHYAESIRGMAREAAAASVPMVLVSVPVNLRDWRPNVSAPPPTGAEEQEWQRRIDRGRRALERRDSRAALADLRAAAALAPTHAETRFWLGRALEAESRFGDAREAYREAADLDQNPFRALSRFNQTLREVAGSLPDVWLADAEAAFADAAAPLAPGFDWFLDYVHPTADGNRLVARSVFDAVIASGVAGEVGERVFIPREASGFDASRDPRVQRTLLLLFAMMHQHEALLARAQSHAERSGPEWRFADRYVRVFAPVVELERRRRAGETISVAERRRVRDRLEAFYERQYPKAIELERQADAE